MAYITELGYYGFDNNIHMADEPEEPDDSDIYETTQTKRVRVTVSFDIDVEVDGWINRDGDFDTDTLEENIQSAVESACEKNKFGDPTLEDWEVIKD